jgi:ribosomal protein S27AE
MNNCACGREISWPLKNCPACSQTFFARLYSPLAGPIQKLAHCSKCGKLEMCSEHGDPWFCPRCKPVQKSDGEKAPETVHKTDKVSAKISSNSQAPTSGLADKRLAEPPTKPRQRKCSLLRWYDLDMRQRVLASRIQDALKLAGGKSGLRGLKQKLHASRYRDWQSAFDWLGGAGVLEVQGKAVVLIEHIPLRLPPRTKRPRRKQTNRPRRLSTEWFDKHRQVYGGHWKSDSRLT